MSPTNAMVVIEIAKNGNGTDIVNIIPAKDRQLLQHANKSDEWLDGRLDQKDLSHHPVSPKVPAEGDFSDFQPNDNSNIALSDSGNNGELSRMHGGVTGQVLAPVPVGEDVSCRASSGGHAEHSCCIFVACSKYLVAKAFASSAMRPPRLESWSMTAVLPSSFDRALIASNMAPSSLWYAIANVAQSSSSRAILAVSVLGVAAMVIPLKVFRS
jgi:hypothetical protein